MASAARRDRHCRIIAIGGGTPYLAEMSQLSVLDLSFTTTAMPASRALARTIELARFVDTLGYARFWVSEHHNLPSVAGPAPEILIGQIASATTRLRVGSGGIMLPNHAPLMVAERFKMLEALFPGRIDLGLGRAPGTDPVTSYALRNRDEARGGDDFLDRLTELRAWGSGEFPEQHPYRRVRVMPDDVPMPPIWLLGSSDYSAQLAAQLGLGFAFAHHFASHDAADAMLKYRTRFEPSEACPHPHAILTLAVICAETDEAAEFHAGSADLGVLRRRRGEFVPLVSPEDAMVYDHTAADRAAIAANRRQLLVGSPATVKRKIDELVDATLADEVMVMTAMFDPDARHRSYALVAEAYGIAAGTGDRTRLAAE